MSLSLRDARADHADKIARESLGPEVRCHVLKAFHLGGGKLAQVGATVKLPRFDALDLQARGLAELV